MPSKETTIKTTTTNNDKIEKSTIQKKSQPQPANKKQQREITPTTLQYITPAGPS